MGGLSVRARLMWVVAFTALAAALGCALAVVIAFERFEHVMVWQRSDAFLARVAERYPELSTLGEHQPDALGALFTQLMLHEPGSQLYLLSPDGSVLMGTGSVRLPTGFRVALSPVREAIRLSRSRELEAAFVMGDDPELMEKGAVVAARELGAPAEGSAPVAYLYLVARNPRLTWARLQSIGMVANLSALLPIGGVIALASLLAAWAVLSVTRPLRMLSDDVARLAQSGFTADADWTVAEPVAGDELGRLRAGFGMLLKVLHQQWAELHRLDTFRRESVSNLSHDLRNPLAAAIVSLETLLAQGDDGAVRAPEASLADVALRNVRQAASMVRSLGELAQLDEPSYRVRRLRLDLLDVLEDIRMRFAERAATQGVDLSVSPAGEAQMAAEVDPELFERAVANVLDNALKHTPRGRRILMVLRPEPRALSVIVRDEGQGIAPAHLPHLFDRHYQAVDTRSAGQPHEGKGLGLTIVQRIMELHEGSVAVSSTLGEGTTVTLRFPA